MRFWSDGFAVCTLVLLALIFAGGAIAKFIPRRFPVPRSMVAGLLGLALGPSLVDVLPIETVQLETVVYHGLALVFIAVALQTPNQAEGRSGEVLAIGFGIPFITALQALLGILLVIVWNAVALPGGQASLHPGFGLMAPLGFSQGPGQALSMGAAWTELGMKDGAAVGLLVAGAGFIWCTIVGSIWLGFRPELLEGADQRERADATSSTEGGIAAEAIMRAIMTIALVYLGTWGVLKGLDVVLGAKPQLRAMVWGFHFLIGLGLALAVRTASPRLGAAPNDNDALGSIAGIVVEITTTAALAALSMQVLAAWWLPIALLTTIAGGITFAACWWLQRRAFASFGYHHALLLFGTCTGTLLTGMALLRAIDPKLETPVASRQVVGSAMAAPLALPLLLFIMPYAVTAYESETFGSLWVTAASLMAYALVIGGVMWLSLRGRVGEATEPEGARE